MKRAFFAYLSVAAIGAVFACFVEAQGVAPSVPATLPSVGAPGGAAAAERPARLVHEGAVVHGVEDRDLAPIQIGPPAPVPPEVAIARPTADEITRINDELKRLVDTDNSAVKPLLEKYQSLLVVTAPRANVAATYTQTQQRMGPKHESFVELAKKGDIDLLFEGDSITDFWTTNGKDAYAKYFGNMKVADFAISGDTTQGVLWGLHNGEGQGFQPKAIMMMIGTNNTGNNTAAEIAEGIGAIVLENRKDFPNAKILLLAVFPRSDPGDPVRAKIADINKAIARLDDHQHVFYMDIGAKFLDDKGVFLPDAFLSDKLHPMEAGYVIWAEAVKDTLAGFMQ